MTTCDALLEGPSTDNGLPRWLSGREFACKEKTWVRSLGWEEPLEKEMATHSSTLAWKIP